MNLFWQIYLVLGYGLCFGVGYICIFILVMWRNKISGFSYQLTKCCWTTKKSSYGKHTMEKHLTLPRCHLPRVWLVINEFLCTTATSSRCTDCETTTYWLLLGLKYIFRGRVALIFGCCDTKMKNKALRMISTYSNMLIILNNLSNNVIKCSDGKKYPWAILPMLSIFICNESLMTL